MKTSIYSIILCLSLFSCKKQSTTTLGGGMLNTQPYSFEVLDKNGNNIIHSANDTLVVTYVLNGVTVSNRLDIFKVQTSAEDATLVSKYNGFMVSDWIPNTTTQGYMTAASGGAFHNYPENLGVRNFNLYLNGINIGVIYLDYWAAIFSLNGTAVTVGNLTGYLVAGYPAVFQNIVSGYSSNFLNGNPVFVLQYNGVITGGGH